VPEEPRIQSFFLTQKSHSAKNAMRANAMMAVFFRTHRVYVKYTPCVLLVHAMCIFCVRNLHKTVCHLQHKIPHDGIVAHHRGAPSDCLLSTAGCKYLTTSAIFDSLTLKMLCAHKIIHYSSFLIRNLFVLLHPKLELRTFKRIKKQWQH